MQGVWSGRILQAPEQPRPKEHLAKKNWGSATGGPTGRLTCAGAARVSFGTLPWRSAARNSIAMAHANTSKASSDTAPSTTMSVSMGRLLDRCQDSSAQHQAAKLHLLARARAALSPPRRQPAIGGQGLCRQRVDCLGKAGYAWAGATEGLDLVSHSRIAPRPSFFGKAP